MLTPQEQIDTTKNIFQNINGYFSYRHLESVETDIENVSCYTYMDGKTLFLFNIMLLTEDIDYQFEEYERYKEILQNKFQHHINRSSIQDLLFFNLMITKDGKDIFYQISEQKKEKNSKKNSKIVKEINTVDIHWVIDTTYNDIYMSSTYGKVIRGLEQDIRDILSGTVTYEAKETKKTSLREVKLTATLIGINTIIFLIIEFVYGGSNIENLIRFGALNTYFVQELNEYWRYISAMFLHGDIYHIVYNMLFLWVFGAGVEKRFSGFTYLGIYFLSGITGGIVSQMFSEPNVVAVGASGAIYGLLGALIAISMTNKEKLIQNRSKNLWLFFLIGIIMSVNSENIDVMAHIGGFIGGIVITALLVVITRSKNEVGTDEER